MSKDTTLPLDPITSRQRSVRMKSATIRRTLNDDGTVTNSFELVQETAVLNTHQSGLVIIERKGDILQTPDQSVVTSFTGTGLPTAAKVLQFLDALSDSLP